MSNEGCVILPNTAEALLEALTKGGTIRPNNDKTITACFGANGVITTSPLAPFPTPPMQGAAPPAQIQRPPAQRPARPPVAANPPAAAQQPGGLPPDTAAVIIGGGADTGLPQRWDPPWQPPGLWR